VSLSRPANIVTPALPAQASPDKVLCRLRLSRAKGEGHKIQGILKSEKRGTSLEVFSMQVI
jgi:hypothetical protein